MHYLTNISEIFKRACVTSLYSRVIIWHLLIRRLVRCDRTRWAFVPKILGGTLENSIENELGSSTSFVNRYFRVLFYVGYFCYSN